MSACRNVPCGVPCHGLFAHADTDGESILRSAALGRGFHLRHHGIACEAGLPDCTRVRPRTRRMELEKFHSRPRDAGGYGSGDGGGCGSRGVAAGKRRPAPTRREDALGENLPVGCQICAKGLPSHGTGRAL